MGKDNIYSIEGTSLLGGQIVIVRALWDEIPDESHRSQALYIARFAIVKGYRLNAENLLTSVGFANVSKDYIGVALIHKKEDGTSAGFRYMFKTEEVLGSYYKEEPVPLPETLLTAEKRDELHNKFWTLLKENRGEDAIKLIPGIVSERQTALFYDSFEDLYKQVAGLENQGFSHIFFLGNQGGGRLFNLFYNAGNNNIQGVFYLTIHEVKGDSSVVAMNFIPMNFSPEAMNQL